MNVECWWNIWLPFYIQSTMWLLKEAHLQVLLRLSELCTKLVINNFSHCIFSTSHMMPKMFCMMKLIHSMINHWSLFTFWCYLYFHMKCRSELISEQGKQSHWKPVWQASTGSTISLQTKSLFTKYMRKRPGTRYWPLSLLSSSYRSQEPNCTTLCYEMK